MLNHAFTSLFHTKCICYSLCHYNTRWRVVTLSWGDTASSYQLDRDKGDNDTPVFVTWQSELDSQHYCMESLGKKILSICSVIVTITP